MTLVWQVGFLMNLKAFPRFKGFPAGGTLQLSVLAMLVGLQCGLATTRVVTLPTRETGLELMHAFAMVSECEL